MSVMVSATSMITLYIGLELLSLSSYVLCILPPQRRAFGRSGPEIFRAWSACERHPALRHFLALRLHGHDELQRHRAAFGRGAPSLGLLLGLVFLLAGIAFKASVVPFHMWTPDVYEGAPTPVTAFFASAPKVAAILLATRVCLDALGACNRRMAPDHDLLALASIFLGGIAAYGQTNIKRLLAYSSINNVGFALIGLAAAGIGGASSVLFYMAVYVVMTLGAFLCVLRMRDQEGRPVETMESLSGLSQTGRDLLPRSPCSCSALAGLPPSSASGPS
jgi:NADH-quinone oxidoreductase subunit N